MSTTYDFQTLSPDDFERLVRDLLSAEWGYELEAFKAGRDGGVDLRYSQPKKKVSFRKPESGSAGALVVQCKRFSPHAFQTLLRLMVKEELPKVAKLKPSRYVLVTSIPLSAVQKDQLLERLSPWCQTVSDIIGADQLNAMLRMHPDILKVHFKLWLSSTATLERILHSGIYNRSIATIDDLKCEISKWVMHDGLGQAQKILEDRHHCTIVGMPGIGKTTLAYLLVYEYYLQGYKVVTVSKDVEEAWDVATSALQSDEKLVILYDDFLGQVSFEHRKFEKNEEHRFVQLLRLVCAKKNLRFVLTTREYILADAKRQHGVFANAGSMIELFTLELSHYTRPNRARILYNHLYFSDLDVSRIHAIVESRVYKKLVQHENFNPRTISGICQNAKYRTLSDAEYLQTIVSELDDPAQIWAHSFDNDIQPSSRTLLFLLASFGSQVPLSLLRQAFLDLVQGFPGDSHGKKFDQSLKEIEGNLTVSDRVFRRNGLGEIVLGFQNPSIRDFVEGRLWSDVGLMVRVLNKAVCFSQVEAIEALVGHLESQHSDKEQKTFFDALFVNAIRLLDVEEVGIVRIAGEKRLVVNGKAFLAHRLALTADFAQMSQDNSIAFSELLVNDFHEAWPDIFKNSSVASIAVLMKRLPGLRGMPSAEVEYIHSKFESALLDVIEEAGWFSDIQPVVNAIKDIKVSASVTEALSAAADWIVKERAESVVEDLSESELIDEIDATEDCQEFLSREHADWLDLLRFHLDKFQEPDEPNDEDWFSSRAGNEEVELDGLFQGLLEREDFLAGEPVSETDK